MSEEGKEQSGRMTPQPTDWGQPLTGADQGQPSPLAPPPTVTRPSYLRLLSAVIFNNRIHVALMPSFVLAMWVLVFRYKLTIAYHLMIILSTAAGYLFNMYTDRAEDAINYPDEGRLSPDSPWMKVIIFLCNSIAALIALRAGWRFFLFGMFVNTWGLLYAVVLPVGRIRIKNIPWLKNAWSAAYWSIGLLLSPFFYLRLSFDPRLMLAIPLAFLLAFWVELMWDLRDTAGDRAAGVRTLPVVYGEAMAHWLLHIINVFVLGFALYGLLNHLLPAAHWVFLVHCAGAAVFLEWYMRMKDRQLASHLYLLYAGSCIIVGVMLGETELVIPSL